MSKQGKKNSLTHGQMVWQGDVSSILLRPGRLPGRCVALGAIEGRKGSLKGLKLICVT